MKHIGTSVCLLVLISALAHSRPERDPRIIGGTDAKSGEFPYQVAIVKKGTATLRCAGALIRNNFVLTSAYCAKMSEASEIQVLVSNIVTTKDSPSIFVDVQQIYVHQEYNTERKFNDIALLKLKNNLDKSSSVDIINVKGTASNEGINDCTLTGWGQETSTGAVSSTLKKLTINALIKTECTRLLGDIATGQFCAGGTSQDKNACVLDEGDPLVCNGELAGIMISAPNCGARDKPSLYTDVSNYKNWIESTINAAPANNMSTFMLVAMFATLMALWHNRS